MKLQNEWKLINYIFYSAQLYLTLFFFIQTEITYHKIILMCELKIAIFNFVIKLTTKI